MIWDYRLPFSTLTLGERIAVLSELRLRDPLISLVAIAVVTVPFGLMARLGSSSSGNQFAANYGPLIGDVLLAGGVLLLAVVALLCAFSFVVEPSRSVATAYSWLAVAVVVGSICLWLAGYWQEAATDDSFPYSIATPIRIMSLAALIPAVPAQVIHWVRRSRGDERDLLTQSEQKTKASPPLL